MALKDNYSHSKSWQEELNELEYLILFNIKYSSGTATKNSIIKECAEREVYFVDIIREVYKFHYEIDEVIKDNYYNAKGLVPFENICQEAYRRTKKDVLTREFDRVLYNVVLELFHKNNIDYTTVDNSTIFKIIESWHGTFSELEKIFLTSKKSYDNIQAD